MIAAFGSTTMPANDPPFPNPFPPDPPEDPNGSNPPSLSELPSSRPRRRNRKKRTVICVSVLVVVVSGIAGSLWVFARNLGTESYTGPIHVVKREKLVVTVVERGGLESAENSEIVCRVKAKSQTGVATTIKWIIDDGIEVKKGQLL